MADHYSGFRSEIDAVLSECGKLLGDLVEAPRGEGSDENALIDNHLQHFFKAYYELKSRHDDASLSCAVLALTKSGKSTLLNALLGAECLPVNNVPETARICKIIHTPVAGDEQPRMQEGDVEHVGEAAIRLRLQEINSEVRAREHQPNDERILHIHAPLAALEALPISNDSNTKIYLLDTPGPNEAGEEALRFQVERLLDSVDAVIYLLDYTKLKTAEEAAILQRLKGANPLLVRRLSRRLFFAVNKVDQVAQSEGLDEDETREYVAQLITRQLACDEFQLMPEQVLLVSARDALLSRLMLTGRASDASHTLFLRNAFGRRGATRPRPMEELHEAAAEMLQGSGLLELEERVLRFLYAQGGGVKLLATADDIARLLTEVENVALATEGALRGGVEGLAAKAEGLRGDLQGVLQRLDEVLQQTASLHSQITDEIRTHLEALRTRLFRQIMEALDCTATLSPSDPSTSSPPPTTPNSAAAAAAAAAIARAAAAATGQAAAEAEATGSGRWAQVRRRFASLFGSPSSSSGTASGSSTPAGSTASGTGGARTKNREELMAGLAQLHEDVIQQINSEVRDFWGGLEVVCNARNASLVAAVNGHLAELVARVEAAVEQRLEVRLQAVALRLPQPSSQQFHSDLQDLISRGMEERQERHVRVGQKEFLEQRRVRVKGQGLCNFGSYWITAPVTKTFVETYTSTVYQLQPSEVLRHFIELVDSAVDSSEQVLASYVHRYLHSQLDEARAQIQQYGERYISVVTAALDASYEDSEAREAALAHVQARLEGARCLSQQVAGLQRTLVDFVPAALSCCGYEEVQYMDYMSGSEYSTGPPPTSETPPPPTASTPTPPPTSETPPPPATDTAPLPDPWADNDPTPRALNPPPAPLPVHDPTTARAPSPTPSPFLLDQFQLTPSAPPAPITVPLPTPSLPPTAAEPSPSASPMPAPADTTPSSRPADVSHNAAAGDVTGGLIASDAADAVEALVEPLAPFDTHQATSASVTYPPVDPPSPLDPFPPMPASFTYPPAPSPSDSHHAVPASVTYPPVDPPSPMDGHQASPAPGTHLPAQLPSPYCPGVAISYPPADPPSPVSSQASSLYSARSISPDPFRLSISDISGATALPPSPLPPSPNPTAAPPTTDPFHSHPTPTSETPSSRTPSTDIPEIDDLSSPSPPASPTAHVLDPVASASCSIPTPRATSPAVPPPLHYLDDIHNPPPLNLFPLPAPTAPMSTTPPTYPVAPQGPLPANTLQMSPLLPPPVMAPAFPPPAANDPHHLPSTPPLSPTTVTNVTSAIHNYDEMMLMPPPPAPPAPRTPSPTPTDDPRPAALLPPTRAPTPPPSAPLDIPISSTARDSVTTTTSSRPPSLPTSPVLYPPVAPLSSTPATPTLAHGLTLTPGASPSHTPTPGTHSGSTGPAPAPSAGGNRMGPQAYSQAGAPAGPVEEVDVSDYATICVKKDEIPDPPFDYQRGFAEVMSSGGLASSPEYDLVGTPRAPSDDYEDWTIVEGSGSGF